MPLGCALRPCAVAALSDGRWSGGFTAATTVAARVANTPELRCSEGTLCACWPILSAMHAPAVAATHNGLLAPELAAGIARVMSTESIGVDP